MPESISQDSGFACDICEKKVATKEGLQLHIKTVHVQRSFPCKTCGKRFSQSSHLRSHSKAAHDIDIPHKCRVRSCGKEFDSIQDHWTHWKSAHEKISNQVRSLKGNTATSEQYVEKLRKVASRNSRKEDLEAPEESPMDLEQEDNHQGKKPDKTNEVSSEGEESKTDDNVASNTPEDKQSFKCNLCDKQYVYKTGLDRHMKLSHPGELEDDPGIRPSLGLITWQSTPKHGSACKEKDHLIPVPTEDPDKTYLTVSQLIEAVKNSGDDEDIIVENEASAEEEQEVTMIAEKQTFNLYINRLKNTKDRIEYKELELVILAIEDEWLNQRLIDPENIPSLTIDHFSVTNDGKAIIKCLDSSIMEWIGKTLKNLDVNGVKYIAWSDGDKTMVTVLVTGHMTSRTPDKFMRFVIENPINAIPKECKYEIVESDEVTKDGKVYKYMVDREFVGALEKLGWRVIAGAAGKFTFGVAK